jgi:hypothetical protein
MPLETMLAPFASVPSNLNLSAVDAVRFYKELSEPPEVENSAMARLAALPIGFDHAHVFVLNAFAARRADHSQEHGLLRNLSLSKPT